MSKLTANRVVLILHGVVIVLTAAGIFIATTTQSLPKQWQATAAAAGALIGTLTAGTVAVVKYLDGAQKSEALQAQAAQFASSNMASSGNYASGQVSVQILDQADPPAIIPASREQGPSDEDLLSDVGTESLDSNQWLENRQAVPEAVKS